METDEKQIVEQLRQGNEAAYKYLYDNHYAVLCHIANHYVNDKFIAETIVGDVIFHLWEKRRSIFIDVSIRSYLMRSVRNRSLDYLHSQYKQREVLMSGIAAQELALPASLLSDNYPLGRIFEQELESEIEKAIAHLPTECRRVFLLSRIEGKRQEQIAAELGISISTVKYHMKRALTQLSQEIMKNNTY